MHKRYTDRRRGRNRKQYRRRTILTRPSVQVAILLTTALIIFVLLQSAGR